MSGASEIIEQVRREARTVLTEMESKQLLRSLGIDTTEMKLATSAQEAVLSVGRSAIPWSSRSPRRTSLTRVTPAG